MGRHFPGGEVGPDQPVGGPGTGSNNCHAWSGMLADEDVAGWDLKWRRAGPHGHLDDRYGAHVEGKGAGHAGPVGRFADFYVTRRSGGGPQFTLLGADQGGRSQQGAQHDQSQLAERAADLARRPRCRASVRRRQVRVGDPSQWTARRRERDCGSTVWPLPPHCKDSLGSCPDQYGQASL
jgi:hypothetical protein